MKKFIFLFIVALNLYGQSASYAPQVNIGFANSGAIDAFGRLRTVSDYTSLLDASNQYNSSPQIWEDSLTGTADTNHVATESAVYLLTGGTTAGATAIRQTRRYFRYQSGKSQAFVLTGTVGTPKTGTRKRWGYFDHENGLFFQLQGDTLSVVKRSKASGVVIDSVITRANWNGDKVDGTGASGMNIQTGLSRAYIWGGDIEWLGVGRVRMFVYNNGMPVVVHTFYNVGLSDKVYMTSANLPVRYEITNTFGTASAVDTLKAICSTVISEGGQSLADGYGFSASNDSTAITTSIRRAVLSIRKKTTLAGVTNRANVQDISFDIYASASAFYQIVYDGVIGGTSSWTDVNATNSGMQRNVAGTSVTGGIVIYSGYISGASKSSAVISREISGRYPITLNIAGTISKTLSIVVRPLTGSADFQASVNWVESR